MPACTEEYVGRPKEDVGRETAAATEHLSGTLMRPATFTHNVRTRVGVVEDEQIIDVSAVAPDLPQQMHGLLAGGLQHSTRSGRR